MRVSSSLTAGMKSDRREREKMPGIDMTATGQRIRQMRCASGMTIKDVQNACGGISATAVCKWQNGQAVPAIDHLVILAAIWKVRIDDLIVVIS